jgi:hypothetical protein
VQADRIYPLFFDIDLKVTPQQLSDWLPYTLDAIRIIQLELRRLYTNEQDIECLIGFTEPTDKEDANGRSYKKIGLHIHWPQLFVNKSIATFIRHCVLDVIKADPQSVRLQPLNPWEDVVDLNVIQNLTLRLFGSRKVDRCACPSTDECDHPRTNCNPSNGGARGFIDAGRVYNDQNVIWVDAMGAVDEARTDAIKGDHEQILRLSLALKCNQPLSTLREGVEATIKDVAQLYDKTSRKRKGPVTNLDDPNIKLLVGFIKSYFQDVSFDPDQIKTTKHMKSIAYTIPLNTRYCINRLDEHKSNRTFMMVRKLMLRLSFTYILTC